jgi:hypothetical protein
MAGVPAEIDTPAATEAVAEKPQAPPVPAPVLAYPDFVAALRNAWRDFSRPDLLAGNPLLRSRLFAMRDGAGPAELRALLFETVDALFARQSSDG